MCVLAGPLSEFLWINGADICRVGFGPACSRVFLRGDGKLRVRFAVRRKKAPRIAQGGLALAVRIDSGGNLAFLDGQVTGPPDGEGSLFGGENGGRFDEPVYTTIALPSGHWQKARVLRLGVRKGERSFDRGAERVFINAIRGSARGAPVHDCANRNGQPVLGHVLVDGVVGETRQSVRHFLHVDFRLFGSRGFRKTKSRIDDAVKLALVEKLRGSGAQLA